MTDPRATTTLTHWVQMAAWLGVGIWTVAFATTYLQLWLSS
jgi:hypothetical protein